MAKKKIAYETFIVEEGIPIPPKAQGGASYNWSRRNYPFAEMRVGDSFEVPREVQSNTLTKAAIEWTKRYNLPIKFTVRTLTGGRSRIWRTQ